MTKEEEEDRRRPVWYRGIHWFVFPLGSLFITWRGRGGGGLGRITWFLGEQMGISRNWELKRGYRWKLWKNSEGGGGALKFAWKMKTWGRGIAKVIKSYWGDQLHFILFSPKSSPPQPAQAINNDRSLSSLFSHLPAARGLVPRLLPPKRLLGGENEFYPWSKKGAMFPKFPDERRRSFFVYRSIPWGSLSFRPWFINFLDCLIGKDKNIFSILNYFSLRSTDQVKSVCWDMKVSLMRCCEKSVSSSGRSITWRFLHFFFVFKNLR